METLNFDYIEFRGIDRMEPPDFDASVTKYIVYRKMGNKLAFRAGLNRVPVHKSEVNSRGYQPYSNYTMVFYVYGDMYSKSHWSPDCWAPFRVGPEETEVVVGCELNTPIEGEKSQYITVIVRTEPVSEEECRACLHPSSYTSEGQCWGGGSGSSTVEIITHCAVCNATIGTTHEHRS